MNLSGYAPPPPSLRGVRFILVDDQSEVAAALAASLTHYAQMVCVGVFADGQRALDHLKRRRVDLVLLDLLMPAMPGVEFLRRLKKQAGAAVPPVLVLTCDDSDRAVAEVLGWGRMASWSRAPASRRSPARWPTSARAGPCSRRT